MIKLCIYILITFLNTQNVFFDSFLLLKEQIIKIYIENTIDNNYEIVDEKVFTTTSVNVRLYPSKESKCITTLPFNTEVHRIGIGNNNWSKIDLNGYKYYICSSYLSKTPQENINNPYLNTIIKQDGIINNKYLTYVLNEYELLPINLKEYFINQGWSIYVTNKDLDNYFFNDLYGSVQGCTESKTKSIYIEDRTEACLNATIHECGHALDISLGCLSQSEDFNNLYNLEKDIAAQNLSKHCLSNSWEFFAECFYYYIKNNDTLKKICPNTYLYIETLITTIKE